MPHAHDVLAMLQGSFRLHLLTKGDSAVQQRRVAVSGLSGYFEKVWIVAEKNLDTFTAVSDFAAVPPRACWSVGNSLPSDINPALECGLNAVFVPHPHTWTLERQDIRPGGGKLIVIERFADLRKHF